MSRRYTRSFDESRILSVCPKDRVAATPPPRNSDKICKIYGSPLYRPGKATKFPGRWSSQISRQSTRESGKAVRRMHRPPLPPKEIFLAIISFRGCVDPRAIELCQRKISVTPPVIEPATFRIVEQCLTQQRHGVPRRHTQTHQSPHPDGEPSHYRNKFPHSKLVLQQCG